MGCGESSLGASVGPVKIKASTRGLKLKAPKVSSLLRSDLLGDVGDTVGSLVEDVTGVDATIGIKVPKVKVKTVLGQVKVTKKKKKGGKGKKSKAKKHKKAGVGIQGEEEEEEEEEEEDDDEESEEGEESEPEDMDES